MKFDLVMRAYAPFKHFGVAFHGDGRGPTTSRGVTSRVKSWVTFDPVAGSLSSPHGKSDKSSWIIIPHTATAIPMTRVSVVNIGRNSIHFKLHASGANPLLGAAAPNIDMNVSITANVTPGSLNVRAELTGDQFPNVEVLLEDEAATRRMLFTYETDGSPHAGPGRLIGANARPMNAICKSFSLNEEGHFV